MSRQQFGQILDSATQGDAAADDLPHRVAEPLTVGPGDAARLLGVSRTTFSKWARLGLLDAYRAPLPGRYSVDRLREGMRGGRVHDDRLRRHGRACHPIRLAANL